MRTFLVVSFLTLASTLSARAADVVVSSPASSGACQDAGCASSTTVKPDWQAELDETKKSWDACRKDVDTYCEGIQVGSDRLIDCLKTHLTQLSPVCRQAQGL